MLNRNVMVMIGIAPESKVGKYQKITFSTPTKINVNKHGEDDNIYYGVYFTESDFITFNPEKLINNVLSVFRKYLGSVTICISIGYDNDHIPNWLNKYTKIPEVNSVILIDNNSNDNSNNNSDNNDDEEEEDLIDYDDIPDVFDFDDIQDDDFDDSDDDISNNYSQADTSSINKNSSGYRTGNRDIAQMNQASSFLDGILMDIDNSDEDDSDDESIAYGLNKKTKYKSIKYPRSRILKESKNPKKEINNHGVLIYKDKDDYHRDSKAIKGFIEQFFPGKSKYMSEFRKDVLKRWMCSYAVSKKKLRKLEAEYKKSKSSKYLNGFTKSAKTTSNSLVKITEDAWNDPNR